ncbi:MULTISPECIES: hypothetical protein [Prochlorococcus]|uniref:hypothetical protein n=1 Tax=Prochlorococcus TaxID=1218 RepID=UPI000533ABC5|nr:MULTISPECIES: hypothetical protein [Prochlorococcus]KGG11943.1 hypothetical protein EV05_1145 [Prochlorococcus sp. MIT 0601]
MYLLIVKDGLVTRYIGPYPTTKTASDDLQRVLISCSNRATWQIHALESSAPKSFNSQQDLLEDEYELKAS